MASWPLSHRLRPGHPGLDTCSEPPAVQSSSPYPVKSSSGSAFAGSLATGIAARRPRQQGVPKSRASNISLMPESWRRSSGSSNACCYRRACMKKPLRLLLSRRIQSKIRPGPWRPRLLRREIPKCFLVLLQVESPRTPTCTLSSS